MENEKKEYTIEKARPKKNKKKIEENMKDNQHHHPVDCCCSHVISNSETKFSKVLTVAVILRRADGA